MKRAASIRVPQRALVALPGACAALLGVLAAERDRAASWPHGDFLLGALCGILLGVSLLCVAKLRGAGKASG